MSNCLITKTGDVIELFGAGHAIRAKIATKMSLAVFLKTGGCRLRFGYEMIAIEAGKKLTVIQQGIINDLIENHSRIFIIIAEIAGQHKVRETYRPIHRLPEDFT